MFIYVYVCDMNVQIYTHKFLDFSISTRALPITAQLSKSAPLPRGERRAG